jgi:hypothetical protein
VHLTVTAVNDAPVVSAISGPSPVDESTSVDRTYTFTITDPDSTSFTFVGGYPDCGNGSVQGSPSIAGNSGTFDCRFSDGPDTSIVSVKVSDGIDDSNESTKSVTVDNVAPTIAISGAPNVDEGRPYSLTLGAVTDPGTDTVSNYVVHWGDGNSDAYGSNGVKTHTYADGPNGYAITVDLTDEDGIFLDSANALSVTIDNVAPTATFTASSPIDEGSSSTLSFTAASDPSAGDTIAGFHYSFACDGLGASLASTYATAGTSSSTTCSFADNGTYTVKGRIFDRDEGSTDYSATVVVRNVAPTVVAPGAQSSNEGTAKSFDLGSFSDPGVNDNPWAVDVNWGDASSSNFTMATQGTITAQSHTYADGPNDYTVTVMVTDKDGAPDSETFSVHVNNVAPTATLANNGPVNEGSQATVSFSNQFDPSSTDTAAGFHYAFSCTNGVLPTTYAAAGSLSSTTCTFADNGSYTVSGRIFDKDNGFNNYTTTVVVNNVAPTATFTASSPINEGSSSTLSFTAPSDPSSTDTAAGFHYSFACDGLTASLATTYASAGTSSSATCPFADNGSYTVKGRILDKDSGYTDYSATVVVSNMAPVVSAPTLTGGTGSACITGNQTSLTFSFSDAGANDYPGRSTSTGAMGATRWPPRTLREPKGRSPTRTVRGSSP